MACPREKREMIERTLVGEFGVRAEDSKGRRTPEPECEIRTCFQRDVDRITHSKSFRRLKHKTQVYLRPEGDHYRTRLTHTLEVSRLARTIARALDLNEDLTEAMALGHDLGHTPFGHAGERALNKIYEEGFKHYEQSLRVVDILERDGRGLNLCYETRMGILHHTHGAPDDTTEATVVRLADRIAYINSIMLDLIENSGGGKIQMSDYMQEAVDFFHAFMYSDVYTNPIAKGEESKVDGIIGSLFDYYLKHPDKMPDEMQLIASREGVSRAVCDYISGMTDGYAMEKYSEIFIPMSWTVK